MINIFRGDDTVFAGSKFLTFSVQTGLNLSGWKAIFQLGPITKTVEDISSKVFEIELTHEETSQLWYGELCGCIKLIDNEGHIKTVCNKILFNVTNEVIENDYQVIDLTVPNSCEVDLILSVSTPTVSGGAVESVNGYTGNVNLTARDVGALPDTTVIPFVVSQLKNDLQFQTQSDVIALIAQIPKFKISLVQSLPKVGEKMTLYLVPKEGTGNDIYTEYIWIEEAEKFELLGTTAVDLKDYVKKSEFDALIKINEPLTSTEYTSLKENGLINENELYLILDEA